MSQQSGQPFNAADYLVTRHVREGRGAREAVRTPTPTSYADLDELTGDVAAALRARGLRRDDRVMIMAADGLAMLATILGAFRASVVAVPVSTMQTADELGKVLADSGARALMCTAEFWPVVERAVAAAPELGEVIVSGETTDPADAPTALPGHLRLTRWDDLLAAGRAADPAMRATAGTDGDSWALWLYTSGTTGQPKAAMHRHANIRHVCETYGAQVLGIRPDDLTLSVAKMFFAYGIGNTVFFPLSAGAAAVLEGRRPSPDVIAERVRAERPTLFFAVPTFYAALLASSIPDDTFASVRLAASAGEALPAPLLRRFRQRFGVDVIDGIGSTEALHIFLSNRPDDIRPGTTGVAVPGYDVAIRDAEGRSLPPGQPGALFVRGASIALGYWRRTEASRQVFRGEWLVTGDTYVQDEDGYFTCLGRNTDMLKAGGIWVSPAEVEARLLAHPEVSEAAVVGLADADGIDKPVAVVVPAPGAPGSTTDPVDEAALIAWCREGLAHFKAPRHVVFVDDLPKTATGKLQRFKVRALIAAADSLGTEDLTAAGTGAGS